jgi:hypothetical protein
VGNVKIRYYVTRKAWKGSRATWGYWVPTKKMKAAGFTIVICGEDGPQAWSLAQRMNARWDAFRRGERDLPKEAGVPEKFAGRVYLPGSLGEGFARYRKTSAWITAKKPRTKEEWWRVWDEIEPVFGSVDPWTVTMEELDAWYAGAPDDPAIKGLLERLGVREAERVMRIWRALWRAIGSLTRDDGKRYCPRDEDPSLSIRVKSPQKRSVIWYEGEAVRLVKAAVRMKYLGLAAALAVSWDTMLSPVDVRTLTTEQLTADGEGPLFSVARAKTGKAAIGTLSKRTWRLLAEYTKTLPPNLLPTAPIFYTRGGKAGPKGGRPRQPAPYTKDTFGDDFRVVRAALFPGDTRQIADFRRSGGVEAVAGNVDLGALAGKMANSIDQSRELQETYLPHQAAVVRLADAARGRGRNVLRRGNGTGPKS